MFNEITEKDLINYVKKMNDKAPKKLVQSDELFVSLMENADFQLAFSQGTKVLVDFLDSLHVVSIKNLVTKFRANQLFEQLAPQINPELLKINEQGVENDGRLIDLEKYASSDIKDAGTDKNGNYQLSLTVSNLRQPVPFITYSDMYKRIKEVKNENQ